MKRFYEKVSVEPQDGGYGVHLDGRVVKTPAKRPALSPTKAMAEAVAAEWMAQGDKVNPASMPLGKLLYTALDKVACRRDEVITELVGYAKADMLCYPCDFPADLVQKQKELWLPLLTWVREQHDLGFITTTSIAHIDQEEALLEKLRKILEKLDSFRLTAFHNVTGLCSSVCIGLNVLGNNISIEQAWAAAQLDEDFQIEKWGEDDEAKLRTTNMKTDLDAAALFLKLCEE